MDKYLRKVRATFNGGFTVNPGGINQHDLRIGFSVTKSISSSENTASITLYNLSESTRNSMGKEFDEVTLEAGYMPPNGGSNVGIIFKGTIQDVEHRREGDDIVTTIECGDGDKAIRKAFTNKSYPKGTKVEDVVNDAYKELEKQGVTKGEWKFPDDMEPTFKRPYATCGSCKTELDTLGRGKGFYWNIQNGAMEIIPGDGFIGMVTLISPKTGLIDTPTITDNGCKFKTMMDPEIRPNRRVKIESSVIQMNADGGIYRVSQATYSGDNGTGDFFVSGIGEAVKGGKVDEGKK